MVTCRAFKQSASPSSFRSATQAEYHAAIQELCQTYGRTVVARVTRAPKPTTVFIKKQPNSFNPWPVDSLITQDVYNEKYQRPCHKAISGHIRRLLVNQHVLTEDQVEQ